MQMENHEHLNILVQKSSFQQSGTL